MTAAAPEASSAVPYPRPGDSFYDSAAYEFPPDAAAIFEYSDGPNTWAKVRGPRPTARESYPYVHSITIMGGAGKTAIRSIALDYEEHLQDFGLGSPLARDWGEARLQARDRAIYYASRSNLHRLLGAVGPLIFSQALFWIPTGDGVPWTAEQLARDIAANWGVSIPSARIWGNQNRWGPAQTGGGNWDASTLYGAW
jgi:hypothetical protein